MEHGAASLVPCYLPAPVGSMDDIQEVHRLSEWISSGTDWMGALVGLCSCFWQGTFDVYSANQREGELINGSQLEECL